jgi:transcriptional regulator with XRE-family HTH domain
VYYSIEAIYMDATMNIRDMRKQLGDTQSEFAERYNIPFRTVQNWETGMRKPPEYILELLKARIKEDLINKRASALPKYDSNKQDLPKRSDYVGATSWLKAVSESLGDEIVFALDEALMCSGSFGGRSDEFIIWIYGDDRLTRYNGVTVIGNYVSPINVREKNGLKFTDFNRTLSDALANESILDMQGTIEALSRYYYSNGESFQGLSVAPEYQDRFDSLANEAIEYYDE